MRSGKNKLNATMLTVDGQLFRSKKEANRYLELKMLQKAGKISDLKLQVPYELVPAQYEERIEYTPKQHKEKKVKKLVERKIEYVADFTYIDENGEFCAEDTKGLKKGCTYELFKLKRKLMLYVHNIKIKET